MSRIPKVDPKPYVTNPRKSELEKKVNLQAINSMIIGSQVSE